MRAPYSEMDPETLEREYSPSSCVTSTEPYFVAYRERTTQARESNIYREVSYGTVADDRIDLYQPHDANGSVLIYIHGGYWQMLGREESGFMALDLAASGVTTAVVEYTLCPTATLMQIVQQTRRAVRYIAANATSWRLNPKRVWLAGHSAGAHLAAMCLLDPTTAACVGGAFALGGVFELEPLVYTSVNDAVRLSVDDARRLSPSKLVGPGLKELAVFIGRNETAEFHRQSQEVAASWARNDNAAKPCCVVEDRNHFDLPFDLGDRSTELGQAVFNALGVAQ